MYNKDNDLTFIKGMVDTFSISGNEIELSNLISNMVKSLKDNIDISIDKFNNVSVKIEGLSSDLIMLDAHLDQIGFVISGIEENGMINCYMVGGCSLGATEAREFVVLTDKGKIPCVANKKHVHLIKNEKDDLPKNSYDIIFDIGCKTKEEAEKLVEIGDYIGYKPSFGTLQNNLIYGTALDDKIGCFMVFKILENIVESGIKPNKTIVFTFTGQEETGITRLKHLIKKYQPYKVIEFDVTFASDYETVKEKEVGKCDLGNGIVLYVGTLVDTEIKNKLVKFGKENESLKFQRQVLTSGIGYNSDAVYSLGEYADVTIIGIPLRNMHSTVEICSMDDVYSGIELLSKTILDL
jgi:putative aminopeptidase FrvX